MAEKRSPAQHWTAGYRAALEDVEKLAGLRFINLFADLRSDAAAIDRESKKYARRAKAAAERRARELGC